MLAVLVAVFAAAWVPRAEADVAYSFTCGGQAPTTVQVAEMPCGCLDERKALIRAFSCLETAQYSVVTANCVTCAERSDCNCTAPSQSTNSESGSGSDLTEEEKEKIEFREDVENFPWVLLLVFCAIGVSMLACCLCMMQKWKKMQEDDEDKAAQAIARKRKRKNRRGSNLSRSSRSARHIAVVPPAGHVSASHIP